MFTKMAAGMFHSDYGVPHRVLQTDLVPDWSAAEVTTGVSILSALLCSLGVWIHCFNRHSQSVQILLCNARYAERSDYSSGYSKNSDCAIYTVAGKIADEFVYPVTRLTSV